MFTHKGMETFSTEDDTSTIDLPMGSIMWIPYPEPIYTIGMEQQNRIKLRADLRNDNYIVLFILVTREAGKEIETELRRITFTDKESVLQFKDSFLQAFAEQGP